MKDISLGDFIVTRKAEIIGRWVEHITQILVLQTDDVPQLLNDLPIFLEDLVVALREGTNSLDYLVSARSHGRQRKRIGLNIGALAIEFSLVSETILELAHEYGFSPSFAETRLLLRATARGTEHSVTEYATMRDTEVANTAAQHYSFIAHEIRTPLQTAIFAVDFLHKEVGGKTAEHVSRLARSLDLIHDVVDNSLVAVRLQGHPIPRYETLDVKTLVHDAMAACRMLADRKSIQLNTHYDTIEFQADRKLIVSVLTNLLGNAIKFSAPHSLVNMIVRRTEGTVHFEVSDHCGGMAPDLPAKLFQPNVQGNDDRSGFGLGLMIVKQAVVAHGGTIQIRNQPGTGCTFVVEIPLRDSSVVRIEEGAP